MLEDDDGEHDSVEHDAVNAMEEPDEPMSESELPPMCDSCCIVPIWDPSHQGKRGKLCFCNHWLRVDDARVCGAIVTSMGYSAQPGVSNAIVSACGSIEVLAWRNRMVRSCICFISVICVVLMLAPRIVHAYAQPVGSFHVGVRAQQRSCRGDKSGE